MIKVSPSVLAADFANLESEIRRVQKADMLHLDIMDGHFVPNISIGVPVVESVSKVTDLFLDVHLMISRPQDYLEAFSKAGADSICFHLEAECDPKETIRKIHDLGKAAAISLKPATEAEAVFPYLPDLEMVLVMTVEPGFGGQKFQPAMLEKIRKIRQYALEIGKDIDIQVDGGIQLDTAKQVIEAGANVLVAGSFVFHHENPAEVVAALQQLG